MSQNAGGVIIPTPLQPEELLDRLLDKDEEVSVPTNYLLEALMDAQHNRKDQMDHMWRRRRVPHEFQADQFGQPPQENEPEQEFDRVLNYDPDQYGEYAQSRLVADVENDEGYDALLKVLKNIIAARAPKVPDLDTRHKALIAAKARLDKALGAAKQRKLNSADAPTVKNLHRTVSTVTQQTKQDKLYYAIHGEFDTNKVRAPSRLSKIIVDDILSSDFGLTQIKAQYFVSSELLTYFYKYANVVLHHMANSFRKKKEDARGIVAELFQTEPTNLSDYQDLVPALMSEYVHTSQGLSYSHGQLLERLFYANVIIEAFINGWENPNGSYSHTGVTFIALQRALSANKPHGGHYDSKGAMATFVERNLLRKKADNVYADIPDARDMLNNARSFQIFT